MISFWFSNAAATAADDAALQCRCMFIVFVCIHVHLVCRVHSVCAYDWFVCVRCCALLKGRRLQALSLSFRCNSVAIVAQHRHHTLIFQGRFITCSSCWHMDDIKSSPSQFRPTSLDFCSRFILITVRRRLFDEGRSTCIHFNHSDVSIRFLLIAVCVWSLSICKMQSCWLSRHQ